MASGDVGDAVFDLVGFYRGLAGPEASYRWFNRLRPAFEDMALFTVLQVAFTGILAAFTGLLWKLERRRESVEIEIEGASFRDNLLYVRVVNSGLRDSGIRSVQARYESRDDRRELGPARIHILGMDGEARDEQVLRAGDHAEVKAGFERDIPDWKVEDGELELEIEVEPVIGSTVSRICSARQEEDTALYGRPGPQV